MKKGMSPRVHYRDSRPKSVTEKESTEKKVGNPPLSRILNNTDTNRSHS